jgi:membrane protein DedA with SNARE-associated domain
LWRPLAGEPSDSRVENLLKALLVGSHGWAAYGTIFGVLVACGVGVPFPEDVSLIFGGYLVFHGSANLPMMVATGFLGILVGDSLIYWAGRRLGDRARTDHGRLLRRLLTPERRARVEALFARHGEKIVMAARFMPGVRAVSFFTAGSAGMPYARFICFDGLAALASAPAFVFLGFRFGRQLQRVIELLKRFQIATAAAILVIVCGWILWRRWRDNRPGKMTPAEVASMAERRSSQERRRSGGDPLSKHKTL